MKIDHLSVTLRHQLSGEKKSSLQHHKIQRIQIVHPIGLANPDSPYCSLVVIFKSNCLYTQSSSKMAIHDLLGSQSSTHGHLHAKSIRTDVL